MQQFSKNTQSTLNEQYSLKSHYQTELKKKVCGFLLVFRWLNCVHVCTFYGTLTIGCIFANWHQIGRLLIVLSNTHTHANIYPPNSSVTLNLKKTLNALETLHFLMTMRTIIVIVFDFSTYLNYIRHCNTSLDSFCRRRRRRLLLFLWYCFSIIFFSPMGIHITIHNVNVALHSWCFVMLVDYLYGGKSKRRSLSMATMCV